MCHFHCSSSVFVIEITLILFYFQDIDFTCLATILLASKGEGIDWSVSEDDLISTLATAHMLQFDAVEEQIIHYITHSWLSVENCLKVMQITDKLSLTKLHRKAKLLAVNNVNLVIKSRSFLEQPLKEVLEYLSEESLNIDNEKIICEGVINWISADYNARFVYVKDLLTVIRFSQLSSKIIYEYLLMSILKKIPYAKSLLQCIAFKLSPNCDQAVWTQNFGENFRKAAIEHLSLPSRKGSLVPCIVGGILNKNQCADVKMKPFDEKSLLYDNFLFYWIEDGARPVIPLNSVMPSNLEGARIVRKGYYSNLLFSNVCIVCPKANPRYLEKDF